MHLYTDNIYHKTLLLYYEDNRILHGKEDISNSDISLYTFNLSLSYYYYKDAVTSAVFLGLS